MIRLEMLLNRYLDGDLSPEERHELQTLLLAEPSARQQFWSHARLHSSLRLLGEQNWGAREVREGNAAAAEKVVPRAWPTVSSLAAQWFFSAACVVAVLALASWWLMGPSGPRGRGTTVSPASDSFLAIVIDQSPDARWSGVDAPRGIGHAFGRERVWLEHGESTLQLDNGVELKLRGPAQFELYSVDHVMLFQGQVSARVPENAIGFRMDAPGVNVVDLGTEFSVAVDGNGRPRVHVFKGKVRASLPTLPSSRTELEAGETASFDMEHGTVDVGGSDLSLFPSLEADEGLPRTTGSVRYLRRAPDSVLAGTYEHDAIMIFEEQANAVLPEDVTIVRHISNQQTGPESSVAEQVSLPAGTRVRSYLVHFDRLGSHRDSVEATGSIAFDRPVLGLIIHPQTLIYTDSMLGHAGTDYGPARSRQILEMRFIGDPMRSQSSDNSGRFDEVHLGDDDRTVRMALLGGSAVDQFRVLVAVE